MSRSRRAVVGVVLALVAGATSRHLANRKPSLTQIAAELNATLPTQIDEDTELITTEAVDDTFVYHMKMINFERSELDLNVFSTELKNYIVASACSEAEIDDLLGHGITLRYSYTDMNDDFLSSVDVASSDCN